MASRSGIEAGRAFVRMFLHDEELNAQLKGVQNRMRAVGASMQRIGAETLRMGSVMLLPFVAALAVFVPFSDRMKEVQAVTQATAAEFDRLNEKAKTLGRTTSFTASQVAAAMAELGRAGFDPTAIEAATEHTLNLARASGTELPRAAEIMASTLSQFGKTAEDSQEVADTLTATVNSSAQGMEDLAEAMKPVAPIAFEAGASLQETAAAIGILANNGIRGSLAGTALARAYKNLATDNIRKKVEGLGVAVADAAGDMRPMSAIIEDIARQTDDLGNADRLAIFEELFGRGSAAALKLAGAAGGAFNDLQSDIEGWENAAADVAQQMDSGIGGSLRRMLSAVEGVAIALGEAVEGPVADLAEKITNVSGSMSTFISQNKTLVTILGAAGLALVSIGGALIAVGGIIKVVVFAIGAYSAATKAAAAAQAVFLALTGPAGWKVLAAGAVIAAGAVYGVSAALESSAEEAKAAAEENDKASASLKDLDATLKSIDDGGPDVSVTGTDSIVKADLSLQRLAVTVASVRGETERTLRLAAAGDALTALSLLGGNVDQSANDRVADMLQKAIPPAEELQRKLLEVDAAFALLEQPIDPSVRAELQLSIIDEATGAISQIDDLQDEIDRLTGTATEASQALRDMLEAGVPEDVVARYAELRDTRDELLKQQDELTKAERERERAEQRRLSDLRSKADQVKDENTTAEERIELELAELEELRDAIDPESNTPLLDEETYRRALERLHQRQIELASQDAARITGGSRPVSDVRGVEGSQLIVDLINGREDIAERQLKELEEFNENARQLIEVSARTGRLKVVQ